MDKEWHHATVTVLGRVWGFCLSCNRDSQTETCGICKHTLLMDQEQGSAQQGWQQGTRKKAKEGSRTRGMAGIGAISLHVTAATCPCRHCPRPLLELSSPNPQLTQGVELARTPSTPDPVSGLHWPRGQSCTLPSTFMQKASTPHVFPLYLRPCEILAEVDGFCPEYTI